MKTPPLVLMLALAACLLYGCAPLGPTIQTTCDGIPVTAHIDQWIPERCEANLGCAMREKGLWHIWYGDESTKRHECAHVNGMRHTDTVDNCYRVTRAYGPYHRGAVICVDGNGNEAMVRGGL